MPSAHAVTTSYETSSHWCPRDRSIRHRRPQYRRIHGRRVCRRHFHDQAPIDPKREDPLIGNRRAEVQANPFGKSPLSEQWHLLDPFSDRDGPEAIGQVLCGNSGWRGRSRGRTHHCEGPTDDKPGVFLRPPQSTLEVSSFLNIRVADIAKCYFDWKSKGVEFLTEPKDHEFEIRCYMKDPDGYLIEVGESKAEAVEKAA